MSNHSADIGTEANKPNRRTDRRTDRRTHARTHARPKTLCLRRLSVAKT